MNQQRSDDWKMARLATFLLATMGSSSAIVRAQSVNRNRSGRQVWSPRSKERPDPLADQIKLDWDHQECVNGGFVVNGRDQGRPFLNVLADPAAFKATGAGLLRVYRSLRELGLNRERSRLIYTRYATLVPQLDLFDQTTTDTVLAGVRVLPDGSHNTKVEWDKSKITFKPNGFLPDTLDRPSEEKIRLKMGDGQDIWLPASIRDRFPPGDIAIHEGTYRIKAENTPYRTGACGAVLSEEAIDNGSEPVRLILGCENRIKRNPVIVLTAFHMRRNADPMIQLAKGDLYVNLVAFEFDLDSEHLWSIETAHMPLYAYLPLCGASHGLAASAVAVAKGLGLETELAHWLLNDEFEINLPLFRPGKRHFRC